jgi:hypothetical protein
LLWNNLLLLSVTEMRQMKNAIAGLLLLFALPAKAQQDNALGTACHANAAEACYFVIDGLITDALVSEVIEIFEAGLTETFKVLLNSEGGDLNAGLALGRAIRAEGMQTRVGVYQALDAPLLGACLSACAYAFLGGTERFVDENSQLGFHRFAVQGGTQLEGSGGLVIGQMLSATVVSYIVEMGVDARLFTRAAATRFESMYYPDRDERVEYDVDTPSGFDHFFLEPYGSGVVAASKRLGATHGYDRVDQMTAYCWDGQARVLLTVSGENQFIPDADGAVFEVSVSETAQPTRADWSGVDVTSARARTWLNSSGGFIEITFDPADVPISQTTRVFTAWFDRGRASGGLYRATTLLNEMDRQMLQAAFRMCI